MWARALLVLVGALGGCIDDELVTCGDLVCPAGAVCTELGCVHPDQVTACAGKNALDACDTRLVPVGVCVDEICQALECGDTKRIEGIEMCDDGNQRSGDGCSADCLSLEVCGNRYVDPVANELCDEGVPGLSRDGCTSTCTPEIAAWTDITLTLPSGRAETALAYDSVRDRIVMFGGEAGTNSPLGDTWELDGLNVNWFLIDTGGTAPPARRDHAMAFDEARQRTVLFGGAGSALLQNDTWEWDGSQWKQIATTTSPSARSGHCMAYHPVTQKIMMLGGAFGGQATWFFDGANWTSTTQTSPPSAASCAMIWDQAKGAMRLLVLSASIQLWTWNGSAWAFDNFAPIGRPGVAASAGSDGIYLIGGGNALATSDEVVQYVDGTWSLGPTMPFARTNAAAVYAGTAIYVVGGLSPSSQPVADTVRRSTAGWGLVRPALSATEGHAIAYEPLSRKAIVVGGITDLRVWEWNESSWRVRDPDDAELQTPAGRSWFPLAATGTRVLMYGGASFDAVQSDAWSWDDTIGWTRVSEQSAAGERAGHAMTYDTARNRAIIFGGASNNLYLDDTWEWDGVDTWTEIPATATTHPPARAFAALAYDPIRAQTILFGGKDSTTQFGDTWAFDGATSTWQLLAPTTSPSPRHGAGLAFDATRGTLMLHGGSANGSALGDTWEWDGETWRPLDVLSAPPAREAPSLAYDSFNGRMLLYDSSEHLWAHTFSSHSRPADRCGNTDTDGDSLVGCDDPDCWPRCTPLCPPRTTCPASAPRCGDDSCGLVEDSVLCPADCP